MIERRKELRHPLIVYLRVHDQGTDELVGQVVDISPSGMMLVSDTPFQLNGVEQLRVHLPFTEQTERHIDVQAECRWCGPDINEEYYDAGFKFLNRDLKMVEMINGVVEDMGFAA